MNVQQTSVSYTSTENSAQESKILTLLPVDYVVNEVSLNQLYAQVLQAAESLRDKPNEENRQTLLEALTPALDMSIKHVNDPQKNQAPKILLRAMFYTEVQSLLKNTAIATDGIMLKWDQILTRMQTK